MALSITVIDATDATAVATIAGSDPATTNTLYKSPWTGNAGFAPAWTFGRLAWTSVGTRSGDGTIALSGTGFWLWQVTGTASSAAAFASTYQPITDVSATSIQERLMAAVKLRLNGLNLPGITAIMDPTWIMRRRSDVDVLPCIGISVWGADTYQGGTNQQDDITHPVAVALFDKRSGDDRANLSRDLLWKQTIVSAFIRQRLAGVPEVHDCIPEAASNLDVVRYTGSEEICSLVVLRFVSRTLRG